MTAGRQKLLDLAIWGALILSTLAVYAQVAGMEFVNYDDDVYVYQNAHVLAGLTPATVRWAMTAVVSNNWSPITMLSHVLDAQLFEMQSGMHHLMNLFFHILAAGLLYMSLRRATGARGSSAFVAFVFALHPLNTGTVAWVSERKDVLSAFFGFLALYAYVRYCEQPSWRRYLWVAAPFCLALLSKPMLVTFPLVLLLFDIWPLHRTQWPRVLYEKLPLFAFSATIAIVTYVAQKSTGAVQPIPFADRISNALVSYGVYICQMFWPTRLAVLYPYEQGIPAWKIIAAAAAVVAVSTLALLVRKTHAYFTVGWFWYLVTLIPVIGIVQVGTQSHADRYMYIPIVGLSIIVAWGAPELAVGWPSWKPFLMPAAVAVCCVMIVLTWNELPYWRNSGTLYQRAIEITGDNAVVENNLGAYQASLGLHAEAIRHYENAIRIKPDYATAQNNLGQNLRALDGCAVAIPHFEEAIRLDPKYPVPLYNLGFCAANSGNYQAAIPYLEQAIRMEPDYGDARAWLAVSLSNIPGRSEDAVREFQAAVALAPKNGVLLASYGKFLAGLGRKKEAIVQLEEAEFINPDPETTALLRRLRAEPD
jgi:tetratricopeptide (TPR) repeat protein